MIRRTVTNVYRRTERRCIARAKNASASYLFGMHLVPGRYLTTIEWSGRQWAANAQVLPQGHRVLVDVVDDRARCPAPDIVDRFGVFRGTFRTALSDASQQ